MPVKQPSEERVRWPLSEMGLENASFKAEGTEIVTCDFRIGVYFEIILMLFSEKCVYVLNNSWVFWSISQWKSPAY